MAMSRNPRASSSQNRRFVSSQMPTRTFASINCFRYANFVAVSKSTDASSAMNLFQMATTLHRYRWTLLSLTLEAWLSLAWPVYSGVCLHLRPFCHTLLSARVEHVQNLVAPSSSLTGQLLRLFEPRNLSSVRRLIARLTPPSFGFCFTTPCNDLFWCVSICNLCLFYLQFQAIHSFRIRCIA